METLYFIREQEQGLEYAELQYPTRDRDAAIQYATRRQAEVCDRYGCAAFKYAVVERTTVDQPGQPYSQSDRIIYRAY